MNKQFMVFYSWQSDTDTSANKNFINDCLKNAIKENTKYIEVERDTQNVLGAKEIDRTIFEKINNADVFVADISFVAVYIKENSEGKKVKKIPNSNVMLELGYAAGKIGWERVILVFNEDYGDLDDLPFDLRQHLTLPYKLKDKEKAEVRKKLTAQLKGIIDRYYCDGPLAKEDMSLNKLKGYDFISNSVSDKLIGYSIDNYQNYLIIVDEIKNKVETLCSDIGKCNVETVVKRSSFPISESPIHQLAAMNWNQLEFMDAEPFDLDYVLISLKTYFGLDYKEDYFLFGNLKISTKPYLAGFNVGPALEGTNDEKRKRELYCELFQTIKTYEIILEIKDVLSGYRIIPVVVENNSRVKDENIEIDITISKNGNFLDFDKFLELLGEDKVIKIVESGYFTKLFYNYEFSKQITNEENPTIYPRTDFIGREVEEDIESSKEEFENIVLPLYSTYAGSEGVINLERLSPNEKKWAGKVLIVEGDSIKKISYMVKSNKADNSINLDVEIQ